MANIKNEVFALLGQVSDEIIMPRFQNLGDGDIEAKSSPTDLVTIADREAEIWLTPRLQMIVDCPVVGEEACAKTPDLYFVALGPMAWTVDPIDGTRNFVNGNEQFCTMIALTKDGIPQHSWIYQQLTDTLFYAVAGEGGSYEAGGQSKPLGVSPSSDDLDIMVGSGNTLGLDEPHKSAVQARLRLLQGRCSHGSSGIEGALIAGGHHDYMMHGSCTPWDHAPVDLLCREAGGYSAMQDGEAFRAGKPGPYMVAASQSIWERLKVRVWHGE